MIQHRAGRARRLNGFRQNAALTASHRNGIDLLRADQQAVCVLSDQMNVRQLRRENAGNAEFLRSCFRRLGERQRLIAVHVGLRADLEKGSLNVECHVVSSCNINFANKRKEKAKYMDE